jgi:glycerate-2-kinase
MHRIKNYDALATVPARRDALDIIEAGFGAIDTAATVRARVRREQDTLIIADKRYDLTHYRHIHVLGFGKASCEASAALEMILGDRLHAGISIGTRANVCENIKVCEASHPRPSLENVRHSGDLVAQCGTITAEDLVIVVISGGGSAMLCWPESECDQGTKLYEASIRKGLTIQELNVVRKHISSLKGGGLAKLLHPATVVGLIFSDVPGNMQDMVASGPTYPDASTIVDAQVIIDRYDLGSYNLIETPKDPALFANVTNVVLVSNETALQAMSQVAQKLGYTSHVISSDMYDDPEALTARFIDAAGPHTVVLGGGESRLVITTGGGDGGRNQHVALTGALRLTSGQLFASIASDGIDNGDCAGAIVDSSTVERAHHLGFDAHHALQTFDEHALLEKTGSLVLTGPTGANVSDLMVLVTP